MHTQPDTFPIFRPAQIADIPAILEFTKFADAGLTTVPKTTDAVRAYVEASEAFLNGDDTANRVLFVAARETRILGISGIIPKLGLERPFYSFKKSRHARRSSAMGLTVNYETLQLTTDFDGYTELASIFLSPDARGMGVGRLLSLGRLGFIEKHRARFDKRVMADIRGWVDAQGHSPFWDHLTSKFIRTDFDVADRLSASDGRFIMELLPSLPVLMNLLPPIVGECAGRPHDLSAGAMSLLMAAGFAPTDLCDIFDGGPAIECRADDTLIARTSRAVTGVAENPTERCLHFTGEGAEFRAALGLADLPNAKGAADIINLFGQENLQLAMAQDRRI